MTPGTRSKINGIQLGEVRFDFLRSTEDPVIEAHFALLREGDGARCGKFTKMMGWSPRVTAALEQLRVTLEEDAAAEVFDSVASTSLVTGEAPQV